MTSDEQTDPEIAKRLEDGEVALYTGRAHTGSIVRSSLTVLMPLLGWWLNKKEPLQTWRLVVTGQRILLFDGSKDRSFRFEQLSGTDISGRMNRTLLARTADGDETKIGPPAARNSYPELEQALRRAAAVFEANHAGSHESPQVAAPSVYAEADASSSCAPRGA